MIHKMRTIFYKEDALKLLNICISINATLYSKIFQLRINFYYLNTRRTILYPSIETRKN
jgi:hypothetical protein